MAATSRPNTEGRPAEAVASAIETTALIRVSYRSDGPGAATAGCLAQVCSKSGIPYQLTPAPTTATIANDQSPTPITVQPNGDESVALTIREAIDSATTLAANHEVAIDADLIGALEKMWSGPDVDLESRDVIAEHPAEIDDPELGIPTAEPVPGLAYSRWIHAPFSGDEAAVADEFDDLGIPEDTLEKGEWHTIRSLVTVDMAIDGSLDATRTFCTPDPAADPCYSTEGFADLLDAVGREHPGLAITLALDRTTTTSVLDVWADHCQVVHEAIDKASVGRFDGFTILDAPECPVESAAITAARTISTEPTVLVRTDTDVGIAARTDGLAPELCSAIAATMDGTADWTTQAGFVTDGDTPPVETLRETVGDII